MLTATTQLQITVCCWDGEVTGSRGYALLLLAPQVTGVHALIMHGRSDELAT